MSKRWFIILCISLFAVTAMARVQGEGPLAMEAELYDAIVPADTNEFEWVLDSEFDGYSRDGYMRTMPPGTNISSDITRSPRLDYQVDFPEAGTYYVWGRVLAPTSSQNSFHLGDSGQVTADRINVPEIGEWVWKNVANDGHQAVVVLNEPNVVTINCWLRESGICIDKILLTTDPNYVPVGAGPRDPLLGSMLSMDPNDNLLATGDKGMILSIDGIDVNDLTLGTTTFAGEPKWEDQLPEYADNFDLNSDASADDQAYMQTMFDLPITTVYLVERGSGDPGMMVPLDSMGVPMDDPTPFTPDSFGQLPYQAYGNQGSKLMIVTPETPIGGIRILPPEGGNLGIDPASVSGIAGTILKVKPIDSLDASTDEADPNTLTAVLGINGFDVADLVLGTTTADFQKHASYLTTDGDNFDLTTKASHDDATLIETLFPVPVTQIFIMECGANDSGLFQPLDVDGLPLGAPLAFVKEDCQFQDEGLKIMGQTAGGFAITSMFPLGGLQILEQSGIDPASIAGVPAPAITAAPVDDMTFGMNDANDAILTSINGIDTNDLVLGVTTADPAKAGVEDDFNLERDYGNDLNGLAITMFSVPVTQIFIVEKDGNDSGRFRPLDAAGNPIGGYLPFSSEQFSAKINDINSNGDDMSATVITITTEVPVYGIEIWAGGLDPYSISALPVPTP